MHVKPGDKSTLKNALVSIFIGACVSFITVLLQGLLNLIQHIPTDVPGMVVSIAVYLKAISVNHIS